MKSKFSKNWNSSKQPRKQKKYRANAPLHVRTDFLNANLSKDLREKYKKKTMRIKNGDSVRIMRGKFRGKTGKVNGIYNAQSKITIEGIQTNKRDGSKASVKIQPSNVQIKETSERSDSEVNKQNKDNEQNKSQ